MIQIVLPCCYYWLSHSFLHVPLSVSEVCGLPKHEKYENMQNQQCYPEKIDFNKFWSATSETLSEWSLDSELWQTNCAKKDVKRQCDTWKKLKSTLNNYKSGTDKLMIFEPYKTITLLKCY